MTDAGATLRQRTVASLRWQLLGVGGQRAIQLAGPMALARILPATEIGLAATVAFAVAGLEALTAFTGEQTQIWSRRGADDDYVATVFTVRVLRGAVVAGLLCALAPVLAAFFAPGDGAVALFLALAGNGLLDALQSPARAVRMKALQFRRVAVGDFAAALAGTATTVALALWLRSVWALVLGQLVGTALRSLASYAIAPWRPRLRLERTALRELGGYTTGALGTPFLLFLVFAAPVFVLVRLCDTAQVAIYDYAGKIARLPEDIFLRALAPIAQPAYSELRHDPPRLRRAWLRAVAAFLAFGAPLTLVMAWVGNDLPALVFGPRYGSVPGLFAVLAVHGGLAGLTAVVGPLFWAIGVPQHDRRAQLWRCACLYGAGIPATMAYGPIGFAAAATAAIATALAISLWCARDCLQYGSRELLATARRPLLGATALAACLLLADAVSAPAGAWRVLVGGLLGAPFLSLAVRHVLRSSRTAPGDTAGTPLDAATAVRDRAAP